MPSPLTTLPVAEETRPWYKRLTLVCGGLLILSQYAAAQGLVPPGLSSLLDTLGQQAVALAETLLGVGTLVGAYRQLAK